MLGMFPLSAASRMIASVYGCTGPTERYSAIPSMNQRGGFTWASCCMPDPALPRAKMSYWKTCTISCASTCSASPRSPAKKNMFRWRRASVTPPVPSPRSPVTLFCPNSEREPKMRIGFRSLNSWLRSDLRRAYVRSAIWPV